jgi:TonB family protein
MCRFPTTLILSFALIYLPSSVLQPQAKNLANPSSSQNGVVVVKLFAPTYPPAARAARIAGDVDLNLSIRQDGSIESAVVVSGHPLLAGAALDSAQHAQFECRKCPEEASSYRLVYTFQIEGNCDCQPADTASKPGALSQTYPQIAAAPNRVTVTAQILCTCDPASDFRKRRSLRCFYLWRCSY